MGKLPFEEIKREVLVKKETKTDAKYGCIPEDRKTEEIINYGVICINKLAGPTSNQVVDYVKQILNLDKAGHGGTLDPKVTGVLPVALGNSTKVVQALLPAGKEYVALMNIHKDTSKEFIEKTFNELTGKIMQLPPKRSAVKRQLRERKVYYNDILEIDGRDILFKIGSQGGTYIRKYCLAPEMEVITSKGIKSIEQLYKNKELVSVFSYKQNKINNNKITDFQKIPFSGDLIGITTSSGMNLKLTPDHKILTSTIKGDIMKRADEMKEGDFIYRTINFPKITNKKLVADLLDDEYLIHDNFIKEKCKQALIKKFGSIRAVYRKTNLDRKPFLVNSKIDIKIKHLKLAGIFNNYKSKLCCFKTEKGKIIKFNPNLTEDLLYLIGLVASDGNNSKEKNTIRYTRIKFHNNEESLIDKFYNLTKSIFPSIKVTKKIFKGKLFQVETSNSLFATLCAKLGVFSPSRNSNLLPILELDSNLIASFLKGYFDGDGTVYFKIKDKTKGVYSEIQIFSVDFINIKRIHQMLLKLGIQNKIIKNKFSKGAIPSKNEYIFIIKLVDPPSKVRFIQLIGSNHPNKKKKLEELAGYFKNINLKPLDYLYCSLDKLNYLKNLKNRSKLGGNLSRMLKLEIPMTNYIYKRLYKLDKRLPRFCDDFTIERVRSTKKIPFNGFVYDITVEKDHNFLVEDGIPLSNCHDFGLKIGSGAHMVQLIRTKAGPFSDKEMYSLQDLKDAYENYKEGNDTKLREIIKPVEFAVKHLGKVWVNDNAVGNLCYGASLNAPGVSKVESLINKNDIIAVFSLKNELVCLGIAVMDSTEIINNDKGLAVKTTKVFMNRDVYPKFRK